MLAGANALAVQGPDGDWQVLQFLTAQMTGPDVWTLSGLLRGAAGDDPVAIPAGAPTVLLDEALVRADLALSERGLPRLWRAAPAGGPPSGPAMSQVEAVWRGVALRPWAPAHLRLRRVGDDAHLSWIRRARRDGDGWDTEVPLGEDREVYRVEILNGETVLRTVEVTTPALVYDAAQRTADCPAPPAGPLVARVAQGSAAWGWGRARRIVMW